LEDAACSALRVRLAALFDEAAARREVVVVAVVALRGCGASTVTGGSAPDRDLLASCATASPEHTAPTTIQDAVASAKQLIEFIRTARVSSFELE
jgi:hypothetical protein